MTHLCSSAHPGAGTDTQGGTQDASATLRLLCTTDIHANLLPFDYFSGQSDQPYGLARIATLIRRARADTDNVLLFDNGDALQGTPVGDITAQPGSGWDGPNPVITAMNLLGYDAATVGNHEFNFGLDWLMAALDQAAFPVTCANVLTSGGTPPATLLPQTLCLDRRIIGTDGRMHPVRIGVIGLVPPQIAIWDSSHLQGRATTKDMVATATRLAPELRAAGADLVVLLAHTGIDTAPPQSGMENAALPLAAISGVDVIMTGHTHDVFPSPAHRGITGVDVPAGTLHGKPAVMAGFRGSHLGVVDLTLTRRAGTWHITGHHAEARPVQDPRDSEPAPPDPQMTAALTRAHRTTCDLVSRPAGQSEVPLHSYLSMVSPSTAVRVITAAQTTAVKRALAGTPLDALPVVSASAAFKTGGRGGPLHFTDIPSGPLSLRHAADLYGFPNTLCALRVTGADLNDWLERAAIGFHQIIPGLAGQMLCDPAVPGHVFDLIDGLTYEIDLSAPPRYDAGGALINPGARRIRNLRHRGAAVAAQAPFILATNNYRANGAGPFVPQPASAVAYQGRRVIRDIIVDHLRSAGTITAAQPPVWRFTPMPGTSVLLETGPGIRAVPGALADAGAVDLGQTDAGFARLSIPL